ncbi:MAG: DUF3047 domain-containing protein [Oleiphilaceae bacterium]|nr:DUF3047 domain-containing protein [Oleiphilaceae bacterium]
MFTAEDIAGWESHSFEGETRYDLVEVDGREAVHARCRDASASGLFYREEIDLGKTPILEWTWRVEETFRDIHETRKSGDDYPARVYAVDEHSLAKWRTRALNYVWASEMPRGSHWENAYQSRAIMVAVQSGSAGDSEGNGQWRTQRRDLREDFRQYHDKDTDRINGLAIMTDCDDTDAPAEAWYGEIRLKAE